jgi:proline iminopeptidase
MRWQMGEGRWAIVSRSLVTVMLFGCASAYTAPVVTPAVVVPAPTPVSTSAPAPVSTRPSEGLLTAAAGPLWYRIVGRGPDTVLVPLGSWLAPALSALGGRHTVVFYDPRHRGQSHEFVDSTAATFDGDVADLDSVRGAIGASRVSVVGYDYYAAVAAAWASKHPERVNRLVLLSPIEPADSLSRTWNPPERMARLDTTAARALVKSRAAGRDTSDAQGYCADFWRVNAPLFVGDTAAIPKLNPEWCQWRNESPARVAVAAERALFSLGPGVDFGVLAQHVAAPTLVMHGRLDLVANPVGSQEWTRRIRGARLLWLNNVGHLPHLEAQDMVVTAINEFLSGAWPPRAGPPQR